MKRVFKIAVFYIIGFLSLGLYFYMDNSQDLNEFLKKADRFRTDYGFAFYASVGLIKLTSLIAGLTIPLTLTILLIREKIKENAL